MTGLRKRCKLILLVIRRQHGKPLALIGGPDDGLDRPALPVFPPAIDTLRIALH